MFIIQKNKFFPLPDYDFSNQRTKVQITGKVVDMDYIKQRGLDDIFYESATSNELKILLDNKLPDILDNIQKPT